MDGDTFAKFVATVLYGGALAAYGLGVYGLARHFKPEIEPATNVAGVLVPNSVIYNPRRFMADETLDFTIDTNGELPGGVTTVSISSSALNLGGLASRLANSRDVEILDVPVSQSQRDSWTFYSPDRIRVN